MTVRCRARLGHNCDHGRDERAVYGDTPMTADGTWDGASVVCTPCYVRLFPFTPSGTAELHEIPKAIQAYREAQRKLEDRVESFRAANAADGYAVTEERIDGGVRLTLWPQAKEGTTVEPVGYAILRNGRPIEWS